MRGDDGKVWLGWQVKIVPHNSDAYWLVRINANDETVLGKDNLTLSDNWGHPVNKAKTTSIENNLFYKKQIDLYNSILYKNKGIANVFPEL